MSLKPATALGLTVNPEAQIILKIVGMRHPLPHSDNVDIWWLDLAEPVSVDRMSSAEMARANAFRFDKDRQRFLSARGQLRSILAKYAGGASDDLQLIDGRNGKPYLEGASFAFNLSRSGDIAIVAIAAEGALGVDLERVDADADMAAVAEDVLSEAERDDMFGLTPIEWRGAFYRRWCAKEAITKATGDGLSADFRQLTIFDRGGALSLEAGQGAYNPDMWTLLPVKCPEGHIAILARDRMVAHVNHRRPDPCMVAE